MASKKQKKKKKTPRVTLQPVSLPPDVEFVAAPGSGFSQPVVDAIGCTMVDIARKKGYALKEDLHAEAKDPDHPLHCQITWDKDAAAIAHQLEQCARMIRAVQIRIRPAIDPATGKPVTGQEDLKPTTFKMFHSVVRPADLVGREDPEEPPPSLNRRGYVTFDRVCNEERFLLQVTAQAVKDLASVEARYRHVMHIPLFRDKFVAAVEAVKAKANQPCTPDGDGDGAGDE